MEWRRLKMKVKLCSFGGVGKWSEEWRWKGFQEERIKGEKGKRSEREEEKPEEILRDEVKLFESNFSTTNPSKEDTFCLRILRFCLLI